MRKLLNWFKKQIAWLMSKKVLTAINSGATYEEVEKIVEE